MSISQATPGHSYFLVMSSTIGTLYDEKTGALELELSHAGGARVTDFDDHEIFVHSLMSTGEVVAFTVHAFDSYWKQRIDELVDVLVEHAPNFKRQLAQHFYQRTAQSAPETSWVFLADPGMSHYFLTSAQPQLHLSAQEALSWLPATS